MEKIRKKAITVIEQRNEIYFEVRQEDFKDICCYLYEERHAILLVMFATDEREKDSLFRVYAVFSIPGADRFISIVLRLNERNPGFPSITSHVPAAHWYEREIMDMFGLIPHGHPDRRRLVFHELLQRRKC